MNIIDTIKMNTRFIELADLTAKTTTFMAKLQKPYVYLAHADMDEADAGTDYLIPLTEEEVQQIKDFRAKDEIGCDDWELLEGSPIMDKILSHLDEGYVFDNFEDLIPRRSYEFTITFPKDSQDVTRRFDAVLTDEEYQGILMWRMKGLDFEQLRKDVPKLAASIENPAKFLNGLYPSDPCRVEFTETDENVKEIQEWK